jgi:2-(1,2-epoxy-1,2-dihydrophenyl)acetyl-CoA isomerase
MPEPVLYDFDNGIASLTLNRPDKGNAIDLALGRALATAIDRLAQQPQLRVVVIRAAGRAFCVGGDIGEMRQADDLPRFLAPAIDTLHAAMRKLAALAAPVIASVQGPVGGGGIALALCGDFVLAGEAMKLRGGYSAIGLTPDLGASWRLARRAGAARAKNILFLNEPLDAAACLDAGVVDAVYPDHELDDAVRALARRLSAGATLSFKRIAELVDGAAGRSLAQQLDLERDYMVASAATDDAREGLRAFIDKRDALFHGR